MTSDSGNSLLASLCHDNLRRIDELLDVLGRVSDSEYTKAAPPCTRGIGVHFRHVLDHYDAFLDGLEAGFIDYDARNRDPQTEASRQRAAERLGRVREALLLLSDDHATGTLDVRMDCGSNCAGNAASSVTRELQFLVSHTVHHDALIAAAMQGLGIAVENGYGVAPSTLRYERRARQTR